MAVKHLQPIASFFVMGTLCFQGEGSFILNVTVARKITYRGDTSVKIICKNIPAYFKNTR